jgi:hypothetical protein
MNVVGSALSLAFLLCVAATDSGKDEKLSSFAGQTGNARTTELKGQLIPSLSSEREFKTDAAVYTLVSNRQSAALFIDTNFLGKTLLLKGRVLAWNRFEATGNWRSIRDGKTNELYYYCDICAIKGIDPGPCMCCREPVHLVEEPEAKSKSQIPNSK